MKKTLTKNFFILFALLTGFQLSAQNVFWEEDFSSNMGLPTGWTAVDTTNQDAIWSWCASPVTASTCIPGWGTYETQPEGGFPSTTADNGFVFLDSDVLTTLPVAHVARMTTTAIDCSNQSEVWFKCESQIGVFELDADENALLRVSTDGVNWTDYTLFEGLTTSERWSNNPEYSFANISDVAANEPTVYLQIHWAGNWEYWWLLDDLQLYDADPTPIFIVAHDMRVNANFYGVSYNAMWPASQLECFSFLADIENVGSSPQTGVNLNITIEENGTEVYTDDLFYGDIAVDSIAINEPFDSCFTPTGPSGTSYTGTYTISADSADLAPDNNSQSFDFVITDTVFSKEFGATTSILPAAGNWEGDQEPHSWAFGNYFYIVDGDNWHGSSVTFGIDDPEAEVVGRILSIYLYKWTIDTDEDGEMDPDERERVAFNIYEITGNETLNGLITLPLLHFPSSAPGPIDLESNQAYVLMVEYATNDEVDFVMAGAEIGYGAMALRSEEDGGIAAGNARYGYMLGVNGDLDVEAYSSAGFTTSIAPVVRLNIAPLVGVDETLDAANVIEISPNPANNKINLNIDLEEMHDRTSLRILDINGRLIMDRSLENVQQQTLQIDVSNYAQGAYFLHFITKDGVRTERFIVQH